MSFLQLNNIIHHPALSGLISYLFIFGLCQINIKTNVLFNKEKNILLTICSFYLLLGSLLSVTLIITYFGLINNLLVKSIYYIICLAGITYIYKIAKNVNYNILFLHINNFITNTNIYIFIITLSILIFYFILSITPVTDADSLHYHIGVPLNILREGGLNVAPDWTMERYIGLGEYFNLIGLSIGTDNIGACLNYFSFLILLYVAYINNKDNKSNILLFYLILSSPLFIFQIPNQKPQLYGVCAIIIPMIALLKLKKLSLSSAIVLLGSIFFAISLKYQYYLSAGICIIMFLYLNKDNFLRNIICCCGIYTLLLLPLHLFKIELYGNPIAPMMSDYITQNRVDNLAWWGFNNWYKDSTDGHGMPLGLFIPNRLGNVSQIIGFGIIGLFYVKNIGIISKKYFVGSIILFLAILFWGQNVSRSFLEPLLLLYFGMAITIDYNSKYIKYFKYIILIQLISITISTLVGVYTLGPGIISEKYRNIVLNKTAAEYSAWNWVNKLLPDDSCIITDFRSGAVIPRRFVLSGYAFLMKNGFSNKLLFNKCKDSMNIYLITSNDIKDVKTLSYTGRVENVEKQGQKIQQTNTHLLNDYIILPKYASKQLTREARNPFNTNYQYWTYIYIINKKLLFQ